MTTLADAIAAVPATEWLLLPDLAIPQTRRALTDLTIEEWRQIGASLRGKTGGYTNRAIGSIRRSLAVARRSRRVRSGRRLKWT